MRVRFGVLGALAIFLATGLISGCTLLDSYVALGDSFTSGPLILPQDKTGPPGCLRSDADYPTLIAPHLHQPVFRDVSCGGARTEDMTASQNVNPDPDNPPQLNALNANTKLVTLGIGANDIRFIEIAEQCVRVAIGHLSGTPCRDYFNRTGRDDVAFGIALFKPKLKAVLDEIKRRSPRAKVFVVGYPAILPETTFLFEACQPTIPIAKGDVPYLRDRVEKALNTAIKTVAEAHGNVFVDTYAPSIGHDACKATTVRWVEPFIPANASLLHPNALGMKATARAVEATMKAHGVSVK